jgi:nucleoside-diphosphate-sugar epimerase
VLVTKKRLLIIGCGDVALRAARLMQGRYRFYGLIRDQTRADGLRTLNITPIVGDLDRAASLRRLGGLAELVLHTAPPPASGEHDKRTTNLLNALSKGRILPQHLVYISTSGVYGNCAGHLVPETRPVNPQTARAIRRVDAEQQLRQWGRQNRVTVCILRAPGIYAAERLPLDRIEDGTPALQAEVDVYTNHIHADDLARIAVNALSHGKPGRIYNAADDCQMKMGDYFDLIADHFQLPRPPRISLTEARTILPATRLSFMLESRRLTSERLRKELRTGLRYPSVVEALKEIASGTI